MLKGGCRCTGKYSLELAPKALPLIFEPGKLASQLGYFFFQPRQALSAACVLTCRSGSLGSIRHNYISGEQVYVA